MSARFLKILSVVVLFHVVLLSLIWVGFSAPLARPGAFFIYEGGRTIDESTSTDGAWSAQGGASAQIGLDVFKASDFNHWAQLRVLDKPSDYAHMGL